MIVKEASHRSLATKLYSRSGSQKHLPLSYIKDKVMTKTSTYIATKART